jgi:hypothetical protein
VEFGDVGGAGGCGWGCHGWGEEALEDLGVGAEHGHEGFKCHGIEVSRTLDETVYMWRWDVVAQ